MLQQHKSAFTWDFFKQKNNPYKLRNTQLLEITKCIIKTYGLINCGINCQIILRNQNPLYISKIKIENGPGAHVLVKSALKLFPFKNCTYIKNKSVEMYLYFSLLLLLLVLLFIFFINLFIQTCNYCFYISVSWFLLVHTCLR